MFLNKHFQYFCEINQKLLNATRHAYCFSKIKLLKLNEIIKFIFKFNVINDDDDVKINFNGF